MVRAKEEYKDGTVKYYYYTYDAGGNIIFELVHDNDKNEDDTGEYVYDAVWRDKLISYNGNEIIYDDCGNPKKYLGYDMSLDTSSGSLCMVSNSDHSYEYRLNFYYDADGLVTEIGYQEKENGEYSKETYYFYTRNGQGDIIGIYRCSDSTLVGTYEYDLWGNPVSKTENVFTTTIKKKEVTIRDEQGILDKNPLRYRGYYYDEEQLLELAKDLLDD